MNQPYKPYYYTVEVVSPVFIGAAKENDYVEGQDYYYEAKHYHFVDKRKLMIEMNSQQLDQYTKALIAGNTGEACKLIKTITDKKPHLLLYSSYAPYPKQDIIRKHIADGMGNLIIPGSSLKGSIAGIIGKYLMNTTNQTRWNPTNLLGGIQNNLMRFLQVGDTTFYGNGEVTYFKIFSADLNNQFDSHNIKGDGMWKHGRRGSHGKYFDINGFVTAAEMLIEKSISECRINWADGLFNLISNDKKHLNAQYYPQFEGNALISIIKKHTKDYLEQERKYFEKFPNDDFNNVIQIIDDLLAANDEPNSALIRLGSGSGFHAITGNWQYKDHINTGIANNAIKYKTRKIAFYPDGDDDIFTLPGFIKLTLQH